MAQHFPLSLSLSLENASILQRIKEGYLVWLKIVSHIPKGQRYTLGARIENKFLDLLEVAHQAYFIEREKKMGKVVQCIFLLDTLKFLLHVGWEAKLISHKHYAEIAEKLDEIGKMLGG
ncbi:MAG: four helix bundle protein [bacterium]|nr:four helix bundle protein [bacterium]